MIKLLILLVKQFSKEILMKVILPLIVISIFFNYNVGLGAVTTAVYIGYIVYINQIRIYTFIGHIRYAKRDMEGAIKWFRKVYYSGKANIKTMISYGYLLLKAGKIEEAEKIFNELLEHKMDNDDKMLTQSNYALVIWKKGQLDEAIALLESVFEDFKTSTLYGSLGYMLIAKGDLDKALEFNLEAYEYNNTNTIILDNLGQTYYLREEYDKAHETYEKLMEKQATFTEAYYNYGLVLIKKEEYEKALENMQKSLTYPISFVSTVTEQEVQTKIKELEEKLQS